ncbi:hypothetical protein HQQ80_07930 [Microbacteriaceae bacterium VKM Ac-2855]|nr:hypothetical protein [Microbacteriaceae bacterium VKM Ac-2855]
MRRLHFAGDSILVGDDVARAIEEYAMHLARRQGADLLILPATSRRDRIDLLLGPSSQLFSEAAEGPTGDEGDESILADIRARQQGERTAGHPLFEEQPQSTEISDFDL